MHMRLAPLVPFACVASLGAQVAAPPAAMHPAPPAMYAYDAIAPGFADLSRFAYESDFSDLVWASRDLATRYDGDFTTIGLADGWMSGGQRAPSPWAPQDPADSLYRVAREHLNRGDYRRAASLFGEIGRKHSSSEYGSASMYYQAFALYRIGGTAELQEALTVLEAQRAKYPPDTQREAARAPRAMVVGASAPLFTTSGRGGSRADSDALAARIAGVLASRGLKDNAAVKRALDARGDACDSEEQSVRASALGALMQSDPAQGRELATRILMRRDECSVPLRRSAIVLVGGRQDDAGASALINAARTDPSVEVRLEAINWLVRMPGDGAVATLDELARTGDDESIRRAAARALGIHPSARARAATRGIIERNEGTEQLRVAAVDGLSDNLTADEATWLRAAYPRITSARVKERIVMAIGRAGGDANEQWLSRLAQDESEPLESRRAALRRLVQVMDVATLARQYDAAADRNVRETVLQALATRSEPAAIDKLIDIARNGTDPSLRRYAISALARSTDPRAAKLLLELVDR